MCEPVTPGQPGHEGSVLFTSPRARRGLLRQRPSTALIAPLSASPTEPKATCGGNST